HLLARASLRSMNSSREEVSAAREARPTSRAT
ncbi:MAG: hypothetical protein ACI841_004301, partial [Planctomycetota bacterium]